MNSTDSNFIAPCSISVCMATYNGALFLREQLESIVGQLRSGDELLVSDDGSSDNTLTVLSLFDSHLQLVGVSRLGGAVANFERVLSYARNDFIVLADQDDVWLPGKLDFIRDILKRKEMVVTNALIVDGHLKPTGKTLFDQVPQSTRLWKNIAGRSSFVGCCMAFRRTLLNIALPFPPMTPWHDWLIGLIACTRSSGISVSTPYSLYRRHDSNASHTGGHSNNSRVFQLLLRLKIVWSLLACLIRAKIRRL